MPQGHATSLATIRRFDQLVAYLRDEMNWPIERGDFEDLTFDYSAEELGIDAKNAAKIDGIKSLRPLSVNQPWGVFFVRFEPKRLPVVALRRILSQVALKKRAGANKADRASWAVDDLLFISNYGEGSERHIAFAHFSQPSERDDLPTLKVLGWDNLDTPLHLEDVADALTHKLAWPEEEANTDAWREKWRAAFTLRHREVIKTSQELSIRLAELARAIRDRIRTALIIETEAGPLTQLMKAFQSALLHDLGADGFADMYAQTIAYGLLSARITDPQKKTADDFAAHMRTSPFLGELMATFLKVGGRRGKTGGPGIDFDELGISEVVDLLDAANMDAVLRDFGDKNPQEDPVIHFYELFLKEYDAKKRMQRGVFYTPRPVVSYIVRSVDELLRTEFGLEDGLADISSWSEMVTRYKNLKIPKGVTPEQIFIQILDPATGTGTFLVEVIDVIYKTLATKWKTQGHNAREVDTLWNEYVPKYLLTRLHGYELLMAPYAIAHLKLGLKLYETGYRFGHGERARIYLTNALEPAGDASQMLLQGVLPALAREAQAVNAIKRKQHFTVVIGNPPYSGLSANMSEAAAALIEPYKYINGVHFGERKHWLHDDYVKFWRLTETSIMKANAGVVGLITNHAFYDNPTFRGMRSSFLQSFSSLRLLDLHGNTMRREKSPLGAEDKNVFEIQQGVAISILSKSPETNTKVCTFGDLWGSQEAKYNALGKRTPRELSTAPISPKADFYFFVPRDEEHIDEYEKWLRLDKVFVVFAGGFITARDHFVVDFDRDALLSRMQVLRDGSISDGKIRKEFFDGLGSDKYPDGDSRGWKLPEARRRAKADRHWREHIARCLYRPFDMRWIYWTDWMIDWPRPEVNGHLLHDGNLGLAFMRQAASGDAYSHFLVSRLPVDNRACYSNKGIMTLAPLYLCGSLSEQTGELALRHEKKTPNFSPTFIKALNAVAGAGGSPTKFSPEDVLRYMVAVFHSPTYRDRYSEFLKSDFPRLPIPNTLKLFSELAQVGEKLISLHLMESPNLTHLTTTYFGSKRPVVGRFKWSDDTIWFDTSKSKDAPEAVNRAGIRGVPEKVWKFQVGGYQVCDKWLKDRRGQELTKDDILHYQKVVAALSQFPKLMEDVDVLVAKNGGWPAAFLSGEKIAAGY